MRIMTTSQNIRSACTRLIVAVFLTLWAAPVFAQGTPAPWVIPQFFDASGNPLSSGKLCTFQAGTSTLVNTYTTAALSVANANPVVMNAGGWPSSSGSIVGIFLTPGESYKFVLKASNATTCVPDTGTTIWSIDNIDAIPIDSAGLDLEGTAGENLVAGDVVYLSDGQGSRDAGEWYKADADNAYSSSEAPFLGMVPTSITAGDTGTIRIKGLVASSGLSASTVYYVSATAGALTSTAPTLVRNVGVGYTTTSILLSPQNNGKIPTLTSAYILNAIQLSGLACGRLTLTTGVPVTTADVTAAATLYYTPYTCTQIGLYTGSVWTPYTFAELSVAAPAAANQMYDAFIDYNDGTPALTLTAWTNDTTRATALTTQNGILVLTGDTQKRYVGSVRTVTASQFNDSYARRHVWNYYNQVESPMRVLEATNTWTYTTSAFQQANASAANQLDFVVGVAEHAIEATLSAQSSNATASVATGVAIGLDSTTAAATGSVIALVTGGGSGEISQLFASVRTIPTVGRHVLTWLERSEATGTTTWYGDNNQPTVQQTGIFGMFVR